MRIGLVTLRSPRGPRTTLKIDRIGAITPMQERGVGSGRQCDRRECGQRGFALGR